MGHCHRIFPTSQSDDPNTIHHCYSVYNGSQQPQSNQTKTVDKCKCVYTGNMRARTHTHTHTHTHKHMHAHARTHTHIQPTNPSLHLRSRRMIEPHMDNRFLVQLSTKMIKHLPNKHTAVYLQTHYDTNPQLTSSQLIGILPTS